MLVTSFVVWWVISTAEGATAPPVNTLNGLLPVILGAGGVAFLGAVVQAYQSFKNSAEQRESKAVGNLERWRDEADSRALQCLDDLNFERGVSAFWQRRAALVEGVALRAGVDVPPCPEPPTHSSG